MRRRLSLLPLIVFGHLALASAVAAGGWALVTVIDPPIRAVAGADTVLALSVRQHGETPVSWPRLTVVGTEATSRSVIRSDAVPTGATGAYTATLAFPAEGSWSLSFESPDLIMDGGAVLDVAPAAVAIAPAAPAGPVAATETPAAPAATDLVGAFAIAILVATLLLVVGLVRHGHTARQGESAVRVHD